MRKHALSRERAACSSLRSTAPALSRRSRSSVILRRLAESPACLSFLACFALQHAQSLVTEDLLGRGWYPQQEHGRPVIPSCFQGHLPAGSLLACPALQCSQQAVVVTLASKLLHQEAEAGFQSADVRKQSLVCMQWDYSVICLVIPMYGGEGGRLAKLMGSGVLLGQLVPGIPEARVQDLLVCSLYRIELCRGIWVAPLLVWMLGQGQFPVRLSACDRDRECVVNVNVYAADHWPFQRRSHYGSE